MTNTISLTVITPAETLLDVSSVQSVQVRLTDGGLGVLPGHAPLVAATSAGPLRYYIEDHGEAALELAAGILQIAENSVTIFSSGLWDKQPVDLKTSDDVDRFTRLTEVLLMGSESKGVDDA